MDTRTELIMEAASIVHEDWCEQELKAFYSRAQEQHKNGVINLGEALRNACFKNGSRRNELFLDIPQLNRYGRKAENLLNDYDTFLYLFNVGAIRVKRFIKRDLTDNEIQALNENYKKETGEENILRNFKELSKASQKENLDAAIGACNVYIQLSQAGVSIEQMQSDPQIRNMIGIGIHADWLKRNMNHPNKELIVPFEQLDDWTKQQDLTVFEALLKVVKSNLEKYKVAVVEGTQIPEYQQIEAKVLGSKKKSI